MFLLTKSARYYYDAEAVKEENSDSKCNQDRARLGLAARASAKDIVLREQGGNGRNPKSQTPYGVGGRNRRDVWSIPTHAYKEAHFATFPPALVEPCILAGTSARGCCQVCGAQWERVVEREREFTRPIDDDPKYAEDFKTTARTKVGLVGRPIVTKSETTGWRPGCECGGEPERSIVLDPFMGSGTTAMVAKLLGRRFLGVEANPKYVVLAHKRLRAACPLMMETKQ